MGRFKVITYPSFGNTPYVKTDSDSFEKAKDSYVAAKDWNYTCVLYDAKDDVFCATYQSSMDNSTISNIVSALSGTAAVAAQSALTGGVSLVSGIGTARMVYSTMRSQLGDGNALVGAMAEARNHAW